MLQNQNFITSYPLESSMGVEVSDSIYFKKFFINFDQLGKRRVAIITILAMLRVEVKRIESNVI